MLVKTSFEITQVIYTCAGAFKTVILAGFVVIIVTTLFYILHNDNELLYRCLASQ